MATKSRFDTIASMLTPHQLSELMVIRDALDKDPMCLEHHKVHPGDKTRTKVEDQNVQPE